MPTRLPTACSRSVEINIQDTSSYESEDIHRSTLVEGVEARTSWREVLYEQCVLSVIQYLSDSANGGVVSLPFEHPDCPPKQGAESSRVRGKYVSVERVSERAGGAEVDWRMATSSDAGGEFSLRKTIGVTV
jgi:hypothetical protein